MTAGPLALIVIAGGASRRMGTTKALLPVPPHGTPLLLHVIERLRPLADETIAVVANDPMLAALAELPAGVQLLADETPGAGPLGGLVAGLEVCTGWAMVVACDLPLVNVELMEALCRTASESDAAGLPRWDAVVPWVNGLCEPLHALYHRRCLPAARSRLAVHELRVNSFLPDVRLRRVDERELRQVDPHLLSFINVNTPHEWQQALALLAASRADRST